MDMIVAEGVLYLKDGAPARRPGHMPDHYQDGCDGGGSVWAVDGDSSAVAAILGRTRSAAASISREEYGLR